LLIRFALEKSFSIFSVPLEINDIDVLTNTWLGLQDGVGISTN